MPNTTRSVAPLRSLRFADHRPGWRQRWRHDRLHAHRILSCLLAVHPCLSLCLVPVELRLLVAILSALVHSGSSALGSQVGSKPGSVTLPRLRVLKLRAIAAC